MTMSNQPKRAPISFGKYAAEFFASEYPKIADLVCDKQTTHVAAVYLFRFDSHLTVDFIQSNIDAFARKIADASGKSVPEARRLFVSCMRTAARNYFGTGWFEISAFSSANVPELQKLRSQNTKLSNLTDSLSDSTNVTPEIDPILLQSLLQNKLPVLVRVYADYCSVCKEVKPAFEEAARAMQGKALFVDLNGPMSLEFKEHYEIKSYPAVLRFYRNEEATKFPREHPMSSENFVAFAAGKELHMDPREGTDIQRVTYDAFDEDVGDLQRKRSRTFQWESMLKRQGIDELDALVNERTEAWHSKIDMAIQCGGTSCDVLPPRSPNVSEGDPPPLCVLLGGGMGAGKTTAVGLVAETPFWKEHGSRVVVVEADAFKQEDPLFRVLRGITHMASKIVHQDSIKAAEELFLKAVNKRRDVVFDGTLSWREYAVQTINMLKDTEYFYERGPGYLTSPSGEVTELYWVRGEKRQTPVDPYQVELVAVTADADISVMRGIVRKISTGRGVRVQDQLQSHALFSKHFEKYIDIVDSVYLFDTTISPTAEDERPGESAHLVAIKPGILFQAPAMVNMAGRAVNGFVVRSPGAYERFLKKRHINTSASSLDELFVEEQANR